jgi:hypothetical protein
MLPEVAVIVVVPRLPVRFASPSVLIVAIDPSEEVHVTPLLMSLDVPSLKTPVAENCCDPCDAEMLRLVGDTTMDVNGEFRIVTVVDPLTPRWVAEIVAEPVATAVATPFALMKTTAALELVQAGPFSTPVLPSPYVAEAVNCCWKPVSSEGDGGVTAMDEIGMSQKPEHDVQIASKVSKCARIVARGKCIACVPCFLP